MATVNCSLIVPVYRNAGSIAELLQAVEGIAERLGGAFEAVFVVDGSPDDSEVLLAAGLERAAYQAQLLSLSRNFGAFAAIREGLRHARGDYLAVMAADLQEPPELIVRFFEVLQGEPVDVVLGTRAARHDAAASKLASNLYWWIYRRLVQPKMPPGGVDVFGCTRGFRDQLLKLESRNTSLVGQLIWLGYRVREVPYVRQARQHGKSAWTWRKKIDYLLDSLFAFTDFPIKALLAAGVFGLVVSVTFALLVLLAKLTGLVSVPGYATTVLLIAFFAGLNLFGLGIVGSYAYRAFENTKGRPAALVASQRRFGAREKAGEKE